MARIRKFCAYRNLERPYTRVSKFREKSFIKATPHVDIVRFDMGNPNREFSHVLKLISKDACQIRHNAFESARMTSNKLLEEELGKGGYFLRIKPYPFHILRENPLAAGAGADRMSTGMKHSFGNPIGSAAQIKKGQTIFLIRVNKSNIALAKKALKRAGYKLPCSTHIEIEENPKK